MTTITFPFTGKVTHLIRNEGELPAEWSGHFNEIKYLEIKKKNSDQVEVVKVVTLDDALLETVGGESKKIQKGNMTFELAKVEAITVEGLNTVEEELFRAVIAWIKV